MLVVAANLLVRSLVKVSKYLKISEFAVSFLLLALATSLPELFVGITSAIEGVSSLAYTVVIGSNIVNLSFVMGITAILSKGIPVSNILKRSDVTYMTIITVLLLLLSADGSISRADGIILLVIYGWHVFTVIKQNKQFKYKNEHKTTGHFVLQMLISALCIALLIIGAYTLVDSAIVFADTLDISLIFVGLILISSGTSFPELFFNLAAISKNHKQIAVGDLMGGVVTNAALVIGVAAIIRPMYLEAIYDIRLSFLFLLIILVLFNIFMHSKKELSRLEGVVLLVIYFTYLISEYYLQSFAS